MIPFFFTRYRKAPLATCISFISSMFLLLAVLFSVGYLLNWSGIKDQFPLGESLLVAACFAVAGFGLGRLAEWLAKRKQQKLAQKEARVGTSRVAPPPSGRFCPKCGSKVQDGDAFCVNCGMKQAR